jgi:hypothetical protein
MPTWCGAPEQGEARLAPMPRLGTLLHGAIERKSYGALLASFDALVVDGLQVHADNCRLPVLDGGSIDTLIAAIKNAPSPGCAIITHDFKGAAARVPVDATAFGLRRDHVLVEVLAIFPHRPDSIEARRHREWVDATRQSFGQALPGGYPNMLGRDTDRATMSFGPNAVRLAHAKRRFDPDNVFSSAIPLPVPGGRDGVIRSTTCSSIY